MFIDFFLELKQARLPVSLREYLTLLEAMRRGLADYSVDDFYYLSRSCLVKDETNLDKFDWIAVVAPAPSTASFPASIDIIVVLGADFTVSPSP